MTLNEAQQFVAGIVALDSKARLFVGDADEFACGAVDDDRPQIVVWVSYDANNVRSEHTLGRFDTYADADEFMAALVQATGVLQEN